MRKPDFTFGILQLIIYYNKNENRTFHLMAGAWLEYVRRSYIPLLSLCLNDLVDRMVCMVSNLQGNFYFFMNCSSNENRL